VPFTPRWITQLVTALSLVITAQAEDVFVTTSEIARADLGIIGNPALADDATSLWINPAGLAMRESGTAFFSKSYKSDNSYTNVMFGGDGFGMSWQRNNMVPSREGPRVLRYNRRLNRWRFGFAGTDPKRTVAFGFAGQYTDTESNYPAANYWAWDIGLLVRPLPSLSVGGTIRNLDAPSAESRTVEVGVGVRPMGDRLTLFGGAVWSGGDMRFSTSDDYLNELTDKLGIKHSPDHWHVGAMANLGPGIEVYGATNQDAVLKVGLNLIFGESSIGTATGYKSGSYAPTWVTARTSAHHRNTVLIPRNHIAEITLSGPIQDYPVHSLFGGSAQSLSRIIAQIDRAATANDVAALYIRIRGIEIGQGVADELRAALVDFRERSGKPIICYTMNADMREYYIASVADSIFMEPMGHLSITGYAAAPMYFRRMLDKIGVQAQFARVGRYKAATEMWTDSTLSDTYRRQLEALLGDWHDRFVGAVAQSRNVSADSIAGLIDRGIYTANDALEHGLIDGIHHEDEAFDAVAQMLGEEDGNKVSLAKRRPYDETWGPRQRIAVVFASGEMITGDGGSDIISGNSFMGAESIKRALEKVREDNSISAVVLRVNSPGGYALAGDMIWREADLLAESDKPFVVSVANVAASGGYYIAAPADTIVSNPGAIVGSIGIFGGKLSADALFDKLGMDVETVQRGTNATIFSLHKPLTADQLALLESDIEQGYSMFLDRVAEGRGMETSDVDSVGQGRIFTGEQGIDAGLVDLSGGLDTAIQLAMEMAGIDGKAQIIPYPKRSSFWEQVVERRVPAVLAPNAINGPWFYDPVSADAR
jgi:protease IV